MLSILNVVIWLCTAFRKGFKELIGLILACGYLRERCKVDQQGLDKHRPPKTLEVYVWMKTCEGLPLVNICQKN
jgi:hypothetical protein